MFARSRSWVTTAWTRERMARRRRPRGACWLSAASWEKAMYALGIKCLLSQIARGGGEDDAAASRRGRDVGLEEEDVDEGRARSSTRARRVRRRMRKTGHQWARRCWLWWRWLKALRMGRRGEREDDGEEVEGEEEGDCGSGEFMLVVVLCVCVFGGLTW